MPRQKARRIFSARQIFLLWDLLVKKIMNNGLSVIRPLNGRLGGGSGGREFAQRLKKALKPTLRICRQTGAKHGMLLLQRPACMGQSRHVVPLRRRTGVLMLEKQRAADTERRQQIAIGRIAVRQQTPSRTGGARRAAGFRAAGDAGRLAGIAFQRIHSGEDVVHLAEERIHEELTLRLIQSEFLQKDPDAFA